MMYFSFYQTAGLETTFNLLVTLFQLMMQEAVE